jgi:hypothetical protein
VIPFDVGAIACLYLLGVVLVKPGRSRRLCAAVCIGSDNSYGVYLSQMLFVNALIWAGWTRLDALVWWPLLCSATVVIVFLAGVALTSLLARTPLAVPLTGRQQRPWSTRRPKATARPANDPAMSGRRLEPVVTEHPGASGPATVAADSDGHAFRTSTPRSERCQSGQRSGVSPLTS